MISALIGRWVAAIVGERIAQWVFGSRLGRLGLGALGAAVLAGIFVLWLKVHDAQIREAAVAKARAEWTITALEERSRIEAEHARKLRDLERADETEEAMRMARLSQLERESDVLAEQIAASGDGLQCRLRPDLHERVQTYIRNLPIGGAAEAAALEADLKAR